MRRAASLMAQRRIDASHVHTHTFALDELPTGLRYARDRIDGAIKVEPKSYQAHMYRGILLQTMKSYQAAIGAFWG